MFNDQGITNIQGPMIDTKRSMNAPASWSAPAERSGDGAFERTGAVRRSEAFRSCESGVGAALCHRTPKPGGGSAALAERGSMTRSSFARTTASGFMLTLLRSSVLRVADVADPRSLQEASWH
jgi:hypothetical protein